MASRALLGKGLEAGLSLYLPFGTRWELYRMTLVLKAGSTSGTRHVYARLSDNLVSDPDGGFALTLADTGAVTTVSASIAAVGGPAPPAGTSTNTLWQGIPVAGQMDQIDIVATLVSGDTFDYYLSLNEVVDK